MFVAIQLTSQMCASLLRWWLNLIFQVFQGSASTCFKWSGHFRHSFVKGLFRDTLSNFYWNWLIFDRQGTKNKLAQFFFETRCRVLCAFVIVQYKLLSMPLYTVSQKRDPDIIDCNFKRD